MRLYYNLYEQVLRRGALLDYAEQRRAYSHYFTGQREVVIKAAVLIYTYPQIYPVRY